MRCYVNYGRFRFLSHWKAGQVRGNSNTTPQPEWSNHPCSPPSVAYPKMVDNGTLKNPFVPPFQLGNISLRSPPLCAIFCILTNCSSGTSLIGKFEAVSRSFIARIAKGRDSGRTRTQRPLVCSLQVCRGPRV
jgi:hypothetical protein